MNKKRTNKKKATPETLRRQKQAIIDYYSKKREDMRDNLVKLERKPL